MPPAIASVLETYVGDYGSPSGGEGSDIATDLAKVYGDVETAETGLLARAAALEAVAPTTGAPITAQVSAKAITSDFNDSISCFNCSSIADLHINQKW